MLQYYKACEGSIAVEYLRISQESASTRLTLSLKITAKLNMLDFYVSFIHTVLLKCVAQHITLRTVSSTYRSHGKRKPSVIYIELICNGDSDGPSIPSLRHL